METAHDTDRAPSNNQLMYNNLYSVISPDASKGARQEWTRQCENRSS